MPAYEYTGQLPQGTAITGTFEAASLDDARRQLAELTIHVSQLVEAPKIRSRRALSREDMLFFNQQLASLAENRIALDQGLRAVARDLRRGPLRGTIESVAADLERGATLDEAIDRQSGRFPPLYANVLRAGAANNDLGATLLNFNQHLTLLNSTRRVIWEAVAYPIIVLILLAGLASYFMMYVVPSFNESLYSDFDIKLPGPTSFLIAVAYAWPTILLVTAAVIIFSWVLWGIFGQFEGGRRIRESITLHIPGIAGAYRASLVARFTHAAAFGARAGQPLPALLRSAGGATGSALMTQDVDRLGTMAETGVTHGQPALITAIIPSLVTYTIQISQNRGQLAEALADLATTYDAVARHKLAIFRVVFTPIIILIVAVIIVISVLSLLLPMLSIMTSLTGG